MQHDYQYLDLVRELLVYTRDRARDAVRTGVSLEQLQKEVDFADFIRRFSGRDIVRAAAFHSFYSQPALQRAYEEAKFASEGAVVGAPK